MKTMRLIVIPTFFYSSFYAEINSTWIKDLNVRPEIMKLLGKKSQDICMDNTFMRPLKCRQPKQK